MIGTFHRAVTPRSVALRTAWLLFAVQGIVCAQDTREIDGKSYSAYRASYFRPHRGLFYSFYLTPVVTVDPLGFGGTSTYGLGGGLRLNFWESKTPPGKLGGLKMTGFYGALAYEYYPRQYNKSYASLWLRIRTIVPLAARSDLVYSTGYGLQGISYRYCFGFEVKNITMFFCGESGGPWFTSLGRHPRTESPYANSGSILLVIPVYERKDR